MVLISIRVTPKSSRNMIVLQPDGSYNIWVTAVPEDGKATTAAIALLAKELGIAKTKLRLKSGAASRTKIVEVINQQVQ